MREFETGRPVVKTLLLTDFVESTNFVAALGDLKAAEIFAAHDHAARELLSEHGGQEIDKSDGFLFLFDRPIDAVRFSLAYHRLLARLSQDLPRPLEARSGIHLGEVVMRTNPSDDVSRGAKPVEVEGLAKAKTARLMACACGNQTLLSESAYKIGHRAAVGADGLDDSVRWVEHGLYPLKGIDEPVRLYEVGYQGEAHLSPPPGAIKAKSGGKVIPLMALLAMVGGVGSFVWSTMQSPPPKLSPAPVIAPKASSPEGRSLKEASEQPELAPSERALAPEAKPEPEASTKRGEEAPNDVKLFEIKVSSDPVGAQIFYGDDVLGETPLSFPVPPSPAAHPIRARLKGYRDKQALCRVEASDLERGFSACALQLKRQAKAKAKRAAPPSDPVKPSKSKPKIHMID